MTTRIAPFEDEVVIYHSEEDGCWVAHSLRTDQVGAGDRIVDAFSDLIKAVHQVCELAEKDETIAYLREAPDWVKAYRDGAKTLPGEIYEVAHKMATGQWPLDLKVDVNPDDDGTFIARMTEGACV